ncbi:6-phosphofructokinase [Marinitoga piezophila KA3]|uniref:Pyrophosphate--fructose 6-phosphate 1-phosphotransferase n=1 Tax=Marinitoga piezophila (strain DSM 14283 / JCM 11233 / KA3) TaxID=443254 RepID=H2J623_MARPK|nr:6-phosphofructokinase [Marinitoga piezophila]AEX85084.1 6-phosphofructokinase [Marinitoga piezophila KA3]
MKNAIYAQSGGVTSVINASAYGVIKAALNAEEIDNIYVAINGINGVFNEELADMGKEDPEQIELLKFTPSSAFGSCRRKLKEESEFEEIFRIFDRYNIKYFFYNGGNDSMDTANKIHQYAQKIGYDIKVMGVPKTVDNDLPETDHTPGFGSIAKYLSVAILEGTLDVKSMAADSTKVFILETMGRHAGWVAASTALAKRHESDGPHIILLPEVPFNKEKFFEKVEKTIEKYGYCSIAASEGIKYADGTFVAARGYKDNFGNVQLGGIGSTLANLIRSELGIKTHYAVPDYLQRSGRHISSQVDVNEAIEVGAMAVKYALEGKSGYMVGIERLMNSPYMSTTKLIPLDNVANETKLVPPEFITEDGMFVNEKFIEYALPLIEGEYYPPYLNGIPLYARLKLNRI